jgi:hypothetical protein
MEDENLKKIIKETSCPSKFVLSFQSTNITCHNIHFGFQSTGQIGTHIGGILRPGKLISSKCFCYRMLPRPER